MTENNETKHSPTPWRAEGESILDANGFPCADGWNPEADYADDGRELAKADAAYIVEAVNAHERLVAENARLRELVRQMGDEMEDLNNCLIITSAISGTTRDADSEARVHALLAEARAALGEEAANDA